ncbi:MAG: restriction endonuclease subunit S [candidate division NC10 bacterium]|nr:restriction endonuclease subunit S [candidate division NC10 bacterium]MDE2321470.1 restriction endonuclease subunit S [candidate division NC10 bacterium]
MPQDRNLSGCQVFEAANLPLNWDCAPLGSRIELAYGRGLREEDRKSGGVDVYGSNGRVGSHNVALVNGPGILIGRKGTIGAVHFTSRPFWPIDTVYYVVPRASDDLRFLHHLLDYLPLGFLNAATGVPGLSRRDAYALRGAFPSPDEQAAIARILDAVDTALERTRAAVDRAQGLRASILADLLSHGVGEGGKVRHDDRRPSDFVITPLGRLPSAWGLSTVERSFDLQNGFTLNAERRARFRKRRYLRVANVQRDALDLTDVQELEAGDTEFAPRVLAMDDLLVVEGHADRMQIGRCARVTEEAAGTTFQNHLFRLRTKGAVLPAFACLWLNSAYAQRFWNARCATSSGLNTINQRTLKRLIVPIPSTPEQQSIASIVEQQRQYLEALIAKQVKLEELKKSLTHDLLTGRVRVSREAKAAAS